MPEGIQRFNALIIMLLVGMFGPAAAQAPLPDDTRLTVVEYDAKADERMGWVSLAWTVKARGNYPENGLFLIERSIDGRRWSKFGEQPFWVSPTLAEEYRFTDRLDDGYRYYRLVARYDGGPTTLLRTTRLELVKALIHISDSLDLDARRLHLTYILDQPKQLLLRLYDRIGQQIFTIKIPSDYAGAHDYALDLSALAPGKYLVEFTQVEDDLKVGEVPFSLPAAGAKPAKRAAHLRQ